MCTKMQSRYTNFQKSPYRRRGGGDNPSQAPTRTPVPPPPPPRSIGSLPRFGPLLENPGYATDYVCITMQIKLEYFHS